MKTLLLAETHAPSLAHLQDALKLAGFAVRAFSEPWPALEHVLAEPPDAVVVAADFPELAGQHLAQKLRATAAGQRPVVVVDKGHLGRALGMGAVLPLRADAYVEDPIRGTSELVQKLEGLLAAPRGLPESGISRTLARPAVAAGELTGQVLPALLHASYRLQRSGILVVASGEQVRRLFLRQGAIVGFDGSAREDSFPAHLESLGAIQPGQAAPVQEAVARGMRIATALAEAGATLEPDALLEHWRAFVREGAAQVTGMRRGRFAFYPGEEFLPEVICADLPALTPLLEGPRRTFAIRTFVQPLRPHLDAYPQRSEGFAADLPALGLDTDDLKIAMQMNGRVALRELLAHGRGDLRRTASLAWFLQLTQGLTLSPTPVAEGANVGPETLVPKKRKPLPPEQIAELREAALRILASSHFGALGVPITAETEQIEAAYQRVAPRFHADGYPENDVEALQDLFDSVQEKVAAAYRILGDPDKRRGYLQHLLPKLGLARVAPIQVDAELASQRGQAALARRDLRSAVVALETAVASSPKEPGFHAALAWAIYLNGPGQAEDRAKATQKALKKALALDPALERAQVLSAVIDLELGDLPGARKKLTRLLEQNPTSRIAKAALRRANR